MAGKKKETTKAVAPVKKAAVAEISDLDAMMSADAGAGMEGADRDAFAIPFLRVLQKGSPQVEEGNGAFIKGAKAGQLLNTVTNELYDGKDGIIFLPCAYQRRFIQWGPRGGDGSGFKAELLPEDVAAKRASGEIQEADGKLYLGKPDPKKSDTVVDTRNHFGLILTDDGAAQVLLSLSSTQIKKSKQLMGMLSSVRINGKVPPTWMSKIRITTALESNDKGSWYGIKLESAGFIDDADTYAKGKAFNQIIAEGAARVEYHDQDAAGSSSAADDDDTM